MYLLLVKTNVPIVSQDKYLLLVKQMYLLLVKTNVPIASQDRCTYC